MHHTEEKIRHSAIKLFMRLGFKKTSVDDIAEDAGIGKGTIYNYFPNKQKLFDSAVQWRLEQIEASAETAITDIKRADEKLIAITLSKLACIRQTRLDEDISPAVFMELMQVQLQNKEYLQDETQKISDYLQLGIEQGIFSIERPLEKAKLIHLVLIEFMPRWLLQLTPEEAQEEITNILGMFLEGLLKQQT